MSARRTQKRSVQVLIGLVLPLAGSPLVLSSHSLAENNRSPLYEEMDEGSSFAEDTALRGDTVKLESVLTYAQEHSPAVRAARSRLLAARQVPPQASAYDDPMVMWD